MRHPTIVVGAIALRAGGQRGGLPEEGPHGDDIAKGLVPHVGRGLRGGAVGRGPGPSRPSWAGARPLPSLIERAWPSG